MIAAAAAAATPAHAAAPPKRTIQQPRATDTVRYAPLIVAPAYDTSNGRDTRIIRLYATYLMERERIDIKRHAGPCTSGCPFVRDGECVVCMNTGNLHVCGVGCSHTVIDMESGQQTCSLTMFVQCQGVMMTFDEQQHSQPDARPARPQCEMIPPNLVAAGEKPYSPRTRRVRRIATSSGSKVAYEECRANVGAMTASGCVDMVPPVIVNVMTEVTYHMWRMVISTHAHAVDMIPGGQEYTLAAHCAIMVAAMSRAENLPDHLVVDPDGQQLHPTFGWFARAGRVFRLADGVIRGSDLTKQRKALRGLIANTTKQDLVLYVTELRRTIAAHQRAIAELAA